LVTGAVGSVGRAAVHTAKKLGVNVIAASALGSWRKRGCWASRYVAMTTIPRFAGLAMVDALPIRWGRNGRETLGKVKNGGNFGYASVVPDEISN